MPSVFLPKRFSNKLALIVELKCDDSADGTLAQIWEKNYTNMLISIKNVLQYRIRNNNEKNNL